jgi:hypothetical protein
MNLRAAGYTGGVAKRGYTKDTIRGASSEWDVSRPLSSYVRLFGRLLSHPLQFFEVLPKIPDVRAPALFLAFSGLPAAVAWFFAGGLYAAVAALLLPLPVSFALAALYHLGTLGGRFGYVVSWRTLAYPLGYFMILSAVPGLRWVLGVYAGALLLPAALARVQEVPAWRTFAASLLVTAFLVAVVLELF